MTTLRQVLHVARKDLREARWALTVYAVIVALATINAGRSALGFVTEPMFFVVIGGMIVVATMVQADSPVREDAFWATRPLNPFAVLGAKVLLACVAIVGPALIGQAIALRMHGAHASDVAFFLPPGAAIYGLWLLAAILVASYTRDVKTFVVVMLCITAGLMIGTSIVFSNLDRRNAPEPTPSFLSLARIVAFVGVIGVAALVIALYRSRTRVRGWAVAMVIGVVCTLYTVTAPSLTGAPRRVRAESRGSAPSISVSIRAADMRFDRSDLPIAITMPVLPPNLNLAFQPTAVTLDLRDGSSLRLPILGAMTDFGTTRPPLTGADWMAGGSDAISDATLSMQLDFAARQRIKVGIARVHVAGTLTESRPRGPIVLQLTRGAAATSHGRRLSVDSWAFGSGEASLKLRSWLLPFDEAPSDFGFGPLSAIRYVLVNDGAHEAVALRSGGTSGSSSWLVLPGIQASDASIELAVSAFRIGQPPITPTDAWFRGAHLEAFEWIPVARYDVRADGDYR